jgi:cysteine synthase A
VRTVYELLRDEGLFLGSTSGVNVAAAVQIAKRLGPGHTIVTMLCDTGSKYQGRLFNRKWLAEKGLLEAAGLALHVQPAPASITETPRVVDGYPQRLRA